jgi:hypothetical protein
MRMRAPTALGVTVALAACAGGPSGPPTLGYAVPGGAEATYLVGDTLTIGLLVPGQAMEIAARSAATYALRYGSAPSGVRVTATVTELTADVAMPTADPVTMDESALEGDFVFELDERGRVTSMSSPRATQIGAQVFGAPVVAHALFPRLPGRPVTVGESWVDSVTYRETGDAGETEYTSSLTYTVVGDSAVAGRVLVDVTFEGTAAVSQDLTVEGATINQAFDVEVDGRLLWDRQARLLYRSEATLEGPGSVNVALFPVALPTRVRWVTRVSLQER